MIRLANLADYPETRAIAALHPEISGWHSGIFESCVVYVLLRRGKIAGFAAIQQRANGWRIIAIGARHKRQGIGRELLRHVHEKHSAPFILKAARPAVPFYFALGYRRCPVNGDEGMFERTR